MSELRKATDSEINEALSRLDGWEIQEGKLHREFKFADFSQAWGFMSRVALLAEQQVHHPEWSNVWNCVKIDLATHDVGGISCKDFELAASIDKLDS